MHRDANCHGGKLSRSKLFTACLLYLFIYFYFFQAHQDTNLEPDLEPLNWLCNLFKYVLEPVVATDLAKHIVYLANYYKYNFASRGHILSESDSHSTFRGENVS